MENFRTHFTPTPGPLQTYEGGYFTAGNRENSVNFTNAIVLVHYSTPFGL